MHRPLCCLLLLLGVVRVVAQDDDSTAYFEARDSIAAISGPASESLLRAADELAAIGLYRDATALLVEAGRTAPDSAATASDESRSPRTRPDPETSWRVTGAADYTHLEDLARADTILPGKKDSLARLLENPLIVFSKASLSWKNAAPFVKTVDPSLYVSNQKAALDLSATLFFARMLSMEAGIKMEKRLMNSTVFAGDPLSGSSQPAVFVGDRMDSLDMAGGRTTVRFESGGDEDLFWFEAPLTFEGCRYRGGRGGYYSFDDYRAAPSVSFSSRNMRRNASIRFFGEYKNYRGAAAGAVTRADSFDVYRVYPEISGELWWGRFSGAVTAGFLYERYPHRGIPRDVRSAEAEARLRAKLFPPLEASLIARYDNRIEGHEGRFNYLKDTTIIKTIFGVPIPKDTAVVRPFDAYFRVRGHETEIVPELRYSFASALAIEARCPLSVRTFPVADSIDGKKLAVPAFILEPLTAFEPELGICYSNESVDLRESVAFTIENIPARPYYTLLSSRGWKAGVDCMGSIAKHISFYAQAEFQYRRYSPYDAKSRTSRNVQASSGVAFKW